MKYEISHFPPIWERRLLLILQQVAVWLNVRILEYVHLTYMSLSIGISKLATFFGHSPKA